MHYPSCHGFAAFHSWKMPLGQNYFLFSYSHILRLSRILTYLHALISIRSLPQYSDFVALFAFSSKIGTGPQYFIWTGTLRMMRDYLGKQKLNYEFIVWEFLRGLRWITSKHKLTACCCLTEIKWFN